MNLRTQQIKIALRHLLEVQDTNIQNGFITHEYLDEELADMHEMCTGELRIHECKMQEARQE